jgi:phosphate starvation-inducible PhoH-like protein
LKEAQSKGREDIRPASDTSISRPDTGVDHDNPDSPHNAHIILAFDDNRLVGELFGQFDDNLARLEKLLHIKATPRGNHVTLKGRPEACEAGRMVLDTLYHKLQSGQAIESGDVDGTVRLALDQDRQLELPEVGNKSRLSYAQIATRRKTITARTPAQDAYIRALDKASLIFASGPAGTGKTYLAVAYAAALLQRGTVDRLILSRPAVEAGERLGFLPGDMKEKVDPYLRPLYDALYDTMPAEKVDKGMQSGMIEIAPLAFMRGRTLSNAVVLLDEAQNTTHMQMKMFLTRLGENSKMIITGDPTQVDLPPGQVSGLAEAQKLLQGIPDVLQITFSDKDVVRHPLVAAIIRAYDKQDKSRHGS